MGRECELTGKRVLFGNTVSNANNRRRTRFHPNLTEKRLFVPELKRFVTVKVSQRAIRTIDKLGGLIQAARKYKKTISPKLEKLLKQAS
jgi:large subunit ribosomal protein L28